MIKDINGNNVVDGNLKNIKDLYEAAILDPNLKYDDIIGFGKYKPFLKTDNRYSNQLCTGCWYPIISVCKDKALHVLIEGNHKAHIGIFQHIVSVNNNNELFSKITNDNPKVAKYFTKKQIEEDEQAKYSKELAFRVAEENKEKIKLNELRGEKIPRVTELTTYLRTTFKDINLKDKATFFQSLQSPLLREQVLKDINYRLTTIEILKNIPNSKSYYYYFNKGDTTHEHGLRELKKNIIEFDFENPKSFNEFSHKNNITAFLKNKFQQLSNIANKKHKP